MKEIGGYIELDKYTMPMLHERALALNCGRNCLAYLIHARNIKKIMLPYFLCDSVRDVCIKDDIEVRHYHITSNFMPVDVVLQEDEWLYLVNYYGQLNNAVLSELAHKHTKIIVDNSQAYFQMPLERADTLYTCRKFFGVADGAFLYTDAVSEMELPRDESYERMQFILGRFERPAEEFYAEYVENNRMFASESIKKMSRLTENLLHGIDYDMVKRQRTKNFVCLHNIFQKTNKLALSVVEGAFMYPLYVENGSEIRKALQKEKIYIPLLWPEVLKACDDGEIEYKMAKSIIPLPVDQRYDVEDMDYLGQKVMKYIS